MPQERYAVDGAHVLGKGQKIGQIPIYIYVLQVVGRCVQNLESNLIEALSTSPKMPTSGAILFVVLFCLLRCNGVVLVLGSLSLSEGYS